MIKIRFVHYMAPSLISFQLKNQIPTDESEHIPLAEKAN